MRTHLPRREIFLFLINLLQTTCRPRAGNRNKMMREGKQLITFHRKIRDRFLMGQQYLPVVSQGASKKRLLKTLCSPNDACMARSSSMRQARRFIDLSISNNCKYKQSILCLGYFKVPGRVTTMHPSTLHTYVLSVQLCPSSHVTQVYKSFKACIILASQNLVIWHSAARTGSSLTNLVNPASIKYRSSNAPRAGDRQAK